MDFWALFTHGLTLVQMLEYFSKKYAGVAYNQQHLLKSLVYFEDAEQDEMPNMLTQISWEKIKKDIEERVALFVTQSITQ